jgi:alpha-galactosidase
MIDATFQIKVDEEHVFVSNGLISIDTELKRGTSDYKWNDGQSIRGVYGEVKVGAAHLRTSFYTEHVIDTNGVQPIEDGFGRGVKWTVEHRSAGWPTLKHIYRCYVDLPYFLVKLEAFQDLAWETNEITPIASFLNDGNIMEVDAGQKSELRALFVPYDNDKWVRYASHKLPCSVESYELTAIYNAESGKGFVIGSITHDVWKTAIQIEGSASSEITRLKVYSGAAGFQTRDTVPHGMVRGFTIESALIFVGAFNDYRAGMERFGQSNAILVPALPWTEGVPVGWNSWSAVMDKLDLDVYVKTSEFFKSKVQNQPHLKDGTVFINFDSFWTNLTANELQQAVDHVRNNGQKPGIYYTPFTFWGGDTNRRIEGVTGEFVYGDILLKDRSGEPLPSLDGGLAIDPTHPAALERITTQLEEFVRLGFDYLKLDFLTHGALEGVHYQTAITTGVQAYNLGMAHIRDLLNPEKIGKSFFINLSIAPLFPHGYAHSRRISCDAFGTIEDTEYMLNAQTLGWWINNTIYRFNDPDHSVLYKSANQRATSEHEGRSRLNASVISGTSMLMGDDYRMEEAVRRTEELLANPEVMGLAKAGITFLPAGEVKDDRATDLFIRRDDESLYLAVFNYDLSTQKVKHILMDQIGLDFHQSFTFKDLWDGSEWKSKPGNESFDIILEPGESKLLQIII